MPEKQINRSKSDLEKVLEIAKKYSEDAEVFPIRCLGVIEATGIPEELREEFKLDCFLFVSSGVAVHCVDEITTCNVCGEPLDFCECACVQEHEHD